jgi:hypothetical protein
MKSSIHTKIMAMLLICLCAGQTFAQCKPYDGYIDHKNGTVTDPRTGTVWMVCALGQTYQAGECKGLAKELHWFAAMDAAKAERFLGQTDWRIPTLRDMDSITEPRTNPQCSIDEFLFTKKQGTIALLNSPTNRTFNESFKDRPKTDPDISITPHFWTTTPPQNWPFHALVSRPSSGFIQGYLRREADSPSHARFIRAGTADSKAEFSQELAAISRRAKQYDELEAKKELARVRLILLEADLAEAKR